MRDALDGVVEVTDPRNVGLVSVSHGVNEFYTVAIPPIVPLLVTDFSITYAEAGLLLTVFFVMYSAFQLPAGVLADRVGKTRLLVAGLAAMAGGILLAAFASDYDALVAAQVVAGIGGSTYHPTGMSLISDVERGSTEGTAMGVFGFGGVVGTAAAPLVIGGLSAAVGWRVALGVAAGVGIVATVALFVTLREPGPVPSAAGLDGSDDEPDPPPGSERPHTTEDRTDGSVDERPANAVPNPPADAWRRVRATVERSLRFRFTPAVALLVLVTMLVSFQLRAVVTFATSFLFESFGGSNAQANAVFFVMLAAGGVSSLWAGSLADRVDRSRVGLVAAGATAVLLGASAGLAHVPGGVDGPAVAVATVVLFLTIGFAVYGCSPVKNAMISEYAGREFSGGLFGVTQTASAVGSAAGPAVIGYLATAHGLDVAFPAIGVASLGIGAAFVGLGRTLE